MILQHISNLVAISAKKGIEHAILSPGSRCAPLTLAFARHPDIHARIISDERSAGFIALGIAQQLEKPVVLVCTSGSATLNYYPAVAEAYFQEIPLLVLTADRPAEWIDQWDGQTIFQPEVFGKHVKKSFQFPDSFSTPDQNWHADRIINEAINLSIQDPPGPVHINIPLREPFYPEIGEEIIFPSNPNVITHFSGGSNLNKESFRNLKERLKSLRKILIVAGQQNPNPKLKSLLNQISSNQNIVVLTDTISNLQSEKTICLHDHWLGIEQLHVSLEPDLIISFGKSVISKSLKQFLRKTKASHWHIQINGEGKDTFQKLTRIISCTPVSFLNWLNKNLPDGQTEFQSNWKKLEKATQISLSHAFEQSEFGEYPALHYLLKKIPAFSKIHVANSMAVRYLNLLGKRPQEIYCNRGTSGIDGSSSTTVGCTFTTKDPVTLITGDLAFFYDRNAFWHNYSMPNLRIILLNNHAGGIFRLIDGPSKQPELEEFFETKQRLTAHHLAAEFGFGHQLVKSQSELETALFDFYKPGIQTRILEIETTSERNAQILKQVKEIIAAELAK